MFKCISMDKNEFLFYTCEQFILYYQKANLKKNQKPNIVRILKTSTSVRINKTYMLIVVLFLSFNIIRKLKGLQIKIAIIDQNKKIIFGI